ncbi:hypothetical protein pb186bvf_004869 [Paramecium bursaria]
MIQDEYRPETSKCSRLEKRRLVSQNHVRQVSQLQNKNNWMTLDQYFRVGAFKVVEVNNEWDRQNNFRIKTGKRQINQFISPPKIKESYDYFRQEQSMRKTQNKYGRANIEQELIQNRINLGSRLAPIQSKLKL